MVSMKLTFTSLHALKPLVVNVSVAGTSAVLIPSTARSTTTDSAGFLECAALWARNRITDGWDDKRRADWLGFCRVGEQVAASQWPA